MSKKRHTVHACPKLPSPVSTLVYDFAHGHVIQEHFHPEDQLVYASRGVMTVRTEEGTWVVPPRRAVWIPAKTAHSIVMSGPVSMRTLYLRARMARKLPRNCCVVNVSSLLQELILHACQFPAMSRRVKAHAHLIDLILDQLATVQAIPLQLALPADPRALRVAAILQRDPSETRSLAALCREVGASKRTIERVFERETSLSLGKWRQQLRLMRFSAATGSGRENHQRSPGCGLQHRQRIHCDVPESTGNNATTVLRTQADAI